MKPNSVNVRIVLSTLIAIIGVLILVRLGIWQLDRLEWRRAFNAHYLEQISLPVLNLNENITDPGLIDYEYRAVKLQGTYEFQNEVFLQNQAYQNLPGYRVLTPFKLSGSDYIVFIDRGWIGLDDINGIDSIDLLAENTHTITGVIRLSQQKNSYGIDPDKSKQTNSKYWMIVNLDRLQLQQKNKVLPVYVQITESSNNNLPYPVPNEIEISEGPHMGYAIQWFFFASVLAIGYPFLLRKSILKTKIKKEILEDDDY